MNVTDTDARAPAAMLAGLPPRPVDNTYWVLPGRLLAGEYPGRTRRDPDSNRLEQLLAGGIDCFVDLTEPDELEPYSLDLPMHIEYLRKPIPDHGVPLEPPHMREILECLDQALAAGRRVFVHCRAGIGRTGMTMGCLLVERGYDGDAALEELNRLWQQNERSEAWAQVPETEEQIAYVRGWRHRRPADAPQLFAVDAVAPVADGPDPLLDPSTLAAARAVRLRFQGALVGLAVGDALAAATQFRRPGTFTPIGDVLGGGPFDLPRGGWSDDTAMALCLAESLLECRGGDPRDQIERYRRWQKDGHLSATGQCLGITAGMTQALAAAQWRRQPFAGTHDPKRLDPEPLSRVAPAVLYAFGRPETAVQLAADAARATCQSPLVVDACKLLAILLHAALSGQPKARILAPDLAAQPIWGPMPPKARIAQIAGGSWRSRKPESIRAGETAGEALEAALWAFDRSSSFREGALLVANLGGASDVAAAVYGQLAGAHYGIDAVPPAWRNALLQRDLIESFADRLLASALLSME